MLLELADAEPTTGNDGPALALLDQAARLGVDTSLTAWRRARRLAAKPARLSRPSRSARPG